MRILEYILLILFAIAGITLIFVTSAHGEEIEAWVLCQPDSFIYVRSFPKKTSDPLGYLYSGDRVFLDGKAKGNFVHIINANTESGDGWVSKGYIVHSEPYEDGHVYRIEASGRVSARRTVGGTRRRWLHTNDIVTVYMVSEDWCLTSQGFIRTSCIDLSQRQDIDDMDPGEMTWEEE